MSILIYPQSLCSGK